MLNLFFNRQDLIFLIKIYQMDMMIRVEQRLVIVLPMDVRQFFTERVQMSKGHDLIIDTADIFTGCRYFTGDDVLIILVFCDHLDHGLVFPGAYICSVCTTAKCKTHGFYGNGFTGAGFACDSIEPAVKIDFSFFYCCKVFNTDVSDHSVVTSLTERSSVILFLQHIVEKLYNDRRVLGIIGDEHNGVISCN